MKPLKFVLLALGLVCLIAVFLPFLKLGEFSVSLWKLKAIKAGPTWIALLGSVAMVAVAGVGVAKGELGRGLAIGATIAGLLIATITFLQFSPEAPFGKVSGIGAKLLLMGGLVGFVAGIVGIVKPERATA